MSWASLGKSGLAGPADLSVFQATSQVMLGKSLLLHVFALSLVYPESKNVAVPRSRTYQRAH